MSTPDTLQKRLRAITITGPNGEHGHLDTDEIAAIIQAFESDGYVRLPNAVQQSKDGKVWLESRGKLLMTGQEFYDRFKAELDKTQGRFLGDDGLLHELPDAPLIGKQAALEAARVASGIATEGETV